MFYGTLRAVSVGGTFCKLRERYVTKLITYADLVYDVILPMIWRAFSCSKE
ncbi:MAG: hypothetical protein JSS83_16415 [Cyanobacteria bacterium SZAS LIN-3]|nr:hypothetical protein [Cyanobacteria bacterium SZAS LIN-3]